MSTGIGCIIIITIITAGTITIIVTIITVTTIIVVATVWGPVLVEMDTTVGAIGIVCGSSGCRELAKKVLISSGPVERDSKLLSQGRCGGGSYLLLLFNSRRMGIVVAVSV